MPSNKNQRALFRSSYPDVFCKKDVLKIFAKFIGKNLCWSPFLNRPKTLLKRILQDRCFPVSFAKFLRTLFIQNTSGRLLLSFRTFVWMIPNVPAFFKIQFKLKSIRLLFQYQLQLLMKRQINLRMIGFPKSTQYLHDPCRLKC